MRPRAPCRLPVDTTYAEPDLPSSRTVAALISIRTAPSTTVLPSRCGTATSAPRGRPWGVRVVVGTAVAGPATRVAASALAERVVRARTRVRVRGRMGRPFEFRWSVEGETL